MTKISEDNLAEEFIKSYPTDNDTYYWYLSRIRLDENDGSPIFERIPARVANGSLEDFLHLKYEGLSFINFAIGPFRNHLNAEKSKYIFRKYGELNSNESENNSDVPKELKEMAQKWKNKAVKISASIIEVKENEAKVKITLTFPKEYFEKNTVQYFEPALMENEKITFLKGGFTFQGETFEDNNEVVSYEKVSTMSFNFKMPNSKTTSHKILLMSGLITNTYMFKCENIYIELTTK